MWFIRHMNLAVQLLRLAPIVLQRDIDSAPVLAPVGTDLNYRIASV